MMVGYRNRALTRPIPQFVLLLEIAASAGSGADDALESAHDIVYRLQDHRGWSRPSRVFHASGQLCHGLMA